MKARNCCNVISQMLSKIPDSKKQLIKDLNWNYNDALYKAPEETIQWERVYNTLLDHVKYPKENWELEVWSIFSTTPIQELKEYFKL